MGTSPQHQFTRNTEVRICYGHNPQDLAEQVFAAQVIAANQGYSISRADTVSDGIWWVTTATFWKDATYESLSSIQFTQRNDGQLIPGDTEEGDSAQSGTG